MAQHLFISSLVFIRETVKSSEWRD